MARIVCVTTGLRGMIHAGLEVAARLRAAGHQVLYASPDDIGATVEADGCEFAALVRPPAEPAPQSGRTGSRWRHKWREIASRNERLRIGIERTRPVDFEQLLERFAADLVLCDFELHEHVVAAHASGRRTVLLNQFCAWWQAPGVPPLDCELLPRSSFAGRLAERWAWRRHRARRRGAIAKTWRRYLGTDRRGVVRRYGASAGLGRHHVRELDFDSVFTYRGLPTWTMTAREFDFPHRVPDWVRYVGPMVHVDRSADFAAERRLRDVIESVPSGRVVLHASLSTMGPTDEAFVRRLFHAVAEQRNWVLILGLGGAPRIADAPANVHVFSWLPQLSTLRVAACSIHHGGIHTIHECIESSVPMVVYSGGRFDQHGNAARVVHHGLGERGDLDDSAATIRERIHRVFMDDDVRQRVIAMRDRFTSYRNERILEQQVDEYLQN